MRKNYSYRPTSFYQHFCRAVIILSVFFLFISGIFIYIFDKNVTPILIDLSDTKAEIAVSDAINSTLNNMLIDEIKYQDLIKVEKNKDGEVVLIQPDTLKISYLQAITANAVQDALDNSMVHELEIPLGQIFGNHVLASFGPSISVTIYPLGNVGVEVRETFVEAGINQTKHQIYLDIETNVRVVVPPITTNVTVNNSFPIAEYIIVGNVPDTVLSFDTP